MTENICIGQQLNIFSQNFVIRGVFQKYYPFCCNSKKHDPIKITLAVFDYPKNLTLFDTECKKVLGSSLLVVRFDYSVWCATFDLP